MNRLKLFLQGAGWSLLILGLMCVPIGYGISPKRDQSVFYNLADMGAFLRWGAVLIGLGLIVLFIGSLLPGRLDD